MTSAPSTRPSHAAHRPWSVRTVVVRLSRKLSATYRIRSGRRLSRLLAILLAAVSPWAAALPEGGQVVAGQAIVTSPTANAMVVNQSTDKAVLNWQSFNIGAGQSMQFVQPGASSVALNRVIGNGASSIFGSLSANGQVFLINPSGVMFAPGAQVNVGGLVASSLDISNGDFMGGRYSFSGAGTGAVDNHGTINAARGGYVLLAGPQVSNTGAISAEAGSVGLLAGSRVSVDTSGSGLVRFSVDAAAAQAAINNSGSITANGGQVVVLASAMGDAMATVVNHSGVIRANSATERNGTIVLSGGATGVVHVTGELSAAGIDSGQTGGTVKVLGDKVGLSGAALIDVSGDAGGGTALVGGNYQGRGPEQNATATFVGEQVRIDASARRTGDGGKVVVWADDTTRFGGRIAAHAGSESGNGGLAEVSGKQYLDYSGFTDLTAANGSTGTLLLDPSNITISTAANSGGLGAGPTFENGTGTAVLNVTTLLGQLAGANVIVNTSPGTGGTGNITVSSNIAYTGGTARSLTLNADGNIAINAAISSSAASLSTNLNAVGSTTFSAAGSLSTFGGDVAIAGAAKTLRGITTTGGTGTGNLTITGTGAVSQASGGLVIKGATSITAGAANNVTLASTTNDFQGGLSVVSGNNVSLRDANALALGASTVNGTLTVVTAGALTQSGAVTVAGTSSLAAGTTNDITLTNAGNNFGGAVSTVSGRNVALTDSGAISLGASTVSGTLNINATGAITQTGALTVTGATTLAAGAANNITLNTSANNFTGVVSVSSGNNVLLRDINALGLGASNVSGALTVTAAGAVTQNGALTVAGISSLAAGTTNDITLTNAGNNFGGAVSTVSGRNVALTDSGAISLGTSTVSGTLNINATGAITQTGAVAVTGNTTLAAGAANDITLNTATNNFANVAITSGNNVAITDVNSLVLGASTVSGNLTLAAAGNITQTGAVNAASLAATLTGATSALNLGTSANNIAVLNAITAPGGVTVTNGNNALAVNGAISTTNGAVSISTGTGGYSQADVDISSGSGNITITADTVALASNTGGNALATTGTLALRPNSAAQAMSLAGASAFDLSAAEIASFATGATGPIVVGNAASSTGVLTVGGAANLAGKVLTLNAGSINDAGSNVITAASLHLNARSGAIGATDGIDIAAGNLRVTTAANASARVVAPDTGGINFGGGASSVGTGTLTATSGSAGTGGGAITQSVGSTITAGTLTAKTLNDTGAAITLNTVANSITNVSLSARNQADTANAAGNIGYRAVGAVNVTLANTTGALALQSSGNITQSGGLVTAGSLSVVGTGTGAVTLGSANNIAGLNAVTAAGGFSLNNGNNAIAVNNAIATTNTAVSLTSGTGATTFGASGAITTGGGNVTLTNSNAAKVLGNINTTGGAATGNLAITGAGVISQQAGTALRVKGATTMAAGATNNVTLNNAANDFTGAVAVTTGNNVSITDSNALVMGTSVVSGTLGLNTTGAITQTGALTVTGATTLAAGAANNITLNTTTNNFIGAVSVASGNNVSLRDTNALAIGASTATSSLTLTAGAAITQTGAITAPTLTAKTLINTGAAITLNNAGNDVGSIDLQARNGADTANAAGTISYRDATGFNVAAVNTTATGGVTLQSNGNITQSGAVTAPSLTVLGTGSGSVNFGIVANNIATLNAITAAGGFTLNNGNNAVTVAGALSTTNNAVLIDTGAGAYTQNNIDVTAGSGPITITADTVNIAANTGNNALATSGVLTLKAKTAGRAMSLSGAAGFDLTSAELTAIATGATGPIVIGDTASTGAMTIGGTVNLAGKTLTLNAGSVNDVGQQTITAQNLTLNANGQIGIDASNGIDVAANNLSVNTTGNANAFVRSTGAVNLGVGGTASNVGSGTLDLTAQGAVTQTAGTGNITAGTLKVKTLDNAGAAITLTNSGNANAAVNLQARNAADTADAAGAIQYSSAGGFDVAALATTGNAILSAGGAVSQSGAIAASGLALAGAGGAYTLAHAANAVTTLAANTGSLDYKQAGALAVGAVGATAGVTATGAVKIETTGAASNLTLDNAVNSSATGDAVVLKAGSANAAGASTGGQFINSAGAGGIVAASGRYLVYSGDPGATLEGVAGYSKRYNSDAAYVPAGAANTFLYRIAPTLTVVADNKTKVYGNSNPLLTGAVTGTIDGDTAAGLGVAYATTALDRTAVAAGPVAITASATNNENYTLAITNGALTITQRALTVSATAQNRVYDGGTAATVTLADNRLAGDALSTSNTSAAFTDKNAGIGKTVNVTGIGVTGADVGNYSFNTTTATTANITPASIANVSGITAASKMQDGTTAATLATGGAGFTGRIGADVLAVGAATGNFDTPAVGNGKPVSITGITLSGADAGNYVLLNTNAAATANVTPAPANMAERTGDGRIANGTALPVLEADDRREQAFRRAAGIRNAQEQAVVTQTPTFRLAGFPDVPNAAGAAGGDCTGASRGPSCFGEVQAGEGQ